MLSVDKTMVSDSVMYKDASIQHQLHNANEIARAAHGLAATNAKFLMKFNYGTDGNDRIVDMELSDDLLENLYDALIDGHEKLVQEKKKRDEKVCRKFNESQVNQIKRVKYDKPWTIVWWKDGDVTRSKCAATDVYSESAGFNACVAKHYFQTAGAYNKVLKTYCTDVHSDKVTSWQDSYDNGYADGHKDGYDEGHKDGYDEGRDDGYDAGYEDGYDEGFEDGKNYERQERKEMNFED